MGQVKMLTVTKPDLPPLEEYLSFLRRIWASKWLTNDGEFVRFFQEKLEDYLKVGNLALLNNGTLALHVALKACDLKGEIITTPFTFATTTNVILWEGLTPVFADIDPETFNIDPEEVEKKITRRTCAILAVHVYGNPCYVEKLQEVAAEHNLRLIYDAAHAFGVDYKDQSVLNFGDISTLSFHATKIFTTGEGGAIVCRDKDLFEKIQLLRNHGIKSEEQIVIPGTNGKMNEFQAALGICNLKRIDAKIKKRKVLYEHYTQKLSPNLQLQKITATKYNYGYMPVCFRDSKTRDKIYFELIKNGIKPRKYFFPLTIDYDYFKPGAGIIHGCRQAYDVSSRVLCLPLYPDLRIEETDKVIEIIQAFVPKRA
jgi:dTDP-4-amino-4,6-dideoxygalactose transaminase